MDAPLLNIGGRSGGHSRKLLKIGASFSCEKVRKTPHFEVKCGVFGGDKRDRTADLLNAIHWKSIALQRFFGFLVVKWWS